MIKNISLKFGRAPGLEHTEIQATPVTVFVGPNNSGKSRILSEIDHFCRTGQKIPGNLIIEDIEFQDFGIEAAQNYIQAITIKPHKHETLAPGEIFVGAKGSRSHVNEQNLLNAVQRPNVRKNEFCTWYLTHNTLRLDGGNRIGLVNQQGGGDMQQPPTSSFQVLFRDDTKRLEVRRIIHDAFGTYFVLDPTHSGQLRVRLSKEPPRPPIEERSLDDRALAFHGAAQPIEEASDGVKAFTGMITEIVAGDPKILLIDEAEAFLHPSLAFNLGKEIASASANSDKRIFVSTHSASFVMGCIHSGTPINIVRLTYRDGVATARILPSADILKLMRNPLLRSTGVMAGLFYENVVVTEGDSDRAFYQEINERLLQYKPEWGIPNCLFINAQNKHTIHTILRPLRELGISAAGIVDIDVIKEGGTVWTSFLKGGFVPEAEHAPLGTLRASMKQKLEETGRDMKREGGIDLLNGTDKEALSNLFDKLDQYGLFTIRAGELESWLKSLNVNGHKSEWLLKIFEKIGEDPDSEGYLKPSEQDVWKFISKIRNWFFDKDRKGIPA